MSQAPVDRTLQGAGLVAAATVGGLGLEYVVRQRIAASLGPDGYGKVYLALAAGTLLAKVAQVGLEQGVKRFASLHIAVGERPLARACVRAALLITLLSSLVMAAGLSVCAPSIAAFLFGGAEDAPLVWIAVWAIPGLALLEVAQNALLAFRRNVSAMLVTPIAEKALTVALVLPALAYPPSVVGSLSGLVVAIAIAALPGCWLAVRDSGQDRGETGSVRGVSRRLLGFSWPLQVAGVSTLLLNRLDATLVGAFASAREVGYVHAALPLAALALIGFTGIAVVLAPPFMEFVAKRDFVGFRAFYLRVQQWGMCVTGPCVAFMVAFPEDLLSTLFSPAFTPAAPLLRLLSLGFLVGAASGPCGAALLALGKTRATMAATLAGLAALCLVDLALLPTMGICAMGAARIAAFATFYGISLVVLRSALGPLGLVRRAASSLACVALSVAAGLLAAGTLGGLHAVFRLAAGGGIVVTVFAAAALLFGVVTAEDRAALAAIWRAYATRRPRAPHSSEPVLGRSAP